MSKTPKLRFKEFSGDWESNKLSNYTEKITRKNKDFLVTNVISNSARNGLVSQRDFFDKDIANQNNIDGYYIIENGDFVYNPRKSLESPYGPINRYNIEDAGVVSPLYLCFKINEKVNGKFLEYYFKSSKWYRFIYQNSDQGARHDRVSIKDSEFFKLNTKFPSLEEQEKVASFFSLIDEKISLQGEKVEALKDYKRGIMQKIFSRELRFKDDEGRNYPEWEEKKLGEIADCLDNKRKPLNSNERADMQGNIPYYGANGVVDFVNDYIFDENIILLAEDGGNFDYFATKPIAQLVKGKSWVNNHAHVLKAKYCTEFLFYSLVHKDIRKYINGTSRAKLNKSDMLDIVVNIPKSLEEQKKIADILGAIYLKIEKEQEKLDSLNEYKKGLLQQMFV